MKEFGEFVLCSGCQFSLEGGKVQDIKFVFPTEGRPDLADLTNDSIFVFCVVDSNSSINDSNRSFDLSSSDRKLDMIDTYNTSRPCLSRMCALNGRCV